jgi:hypothetical protein
MNYSNALPAWLLVSTGSKFCHPTDPRQTVLRQSEAMFKIFTKYRLPDRTDGGWRSDGSQCGRRVLGRVLNGKSIDGLQTGEKQCCLTETQNLATDA